MLLNCNLQAFYVPLYRKQLRKIICGNEDGAGISASPISLLPLHTLHGTVVPLPVSPLVSLLAVDGAPDHQYFSSARLFSSLLLPWFLAFFLMVVFDGGERRVADTQLSRRL